MSAARVVLVRHAESVWNAAGRWQGQTGPGLSVLGRRQADVTAAFIASTERDVRVVFSSDLSRVTETAAPTARMLGLEPQLDKRLREIDVGWWSGLTDAQITERDPATMQAMRGGEDLPRGGAESVADLRERVTAAFFDLVQACDGGTMVLFTHGGPVRSVVAAVLGLPVASERLLAGPGNGSRTVVTFDGGVARLRCYNETAHLAGI